MTVRLHNGLATPPIRDVRRRDRRHNPIGISSSARVSEDDKEEIQDVVYVSSGSDDVPENNSTTREELTPVSKDDGKDVQGKSIGLADGENNGSIPCRGSASASVIDSTDDDTVDDVSCTFVGLLEPEPSEASFQFNEDTAHQGTSNGPIVNTSRFHHDSTDPTTIPGTPQFNFSLEHGSANHSGNHDRIIDYVDWDSQSKPVTCFQCSGQFDLDESHEAARLLSFFEDRNRRTEPDYAEEFEDMHNLFSKQKDYNALEE